MSLLERIRSFVLVFALLGMTPAFIALATAPKLPLPRMVAAAAVVVLGVAWVISWRRKKLGPLIELLTGAVLFVLIGGVSDPHKVQGFFFSVLMYNGLYGALPQLLLRLVLVQGAYFAGGGVEPLSAVGFTAAGVVIWSLGRAIEQQQKLEAERNRAATALAIASREIEIASQIQLALLPKTLVAPGFEVAAVMVPAAEVGGDYYDVLPTADGCFVGIGDVAGHGLNAGLIMLMIQSVVSALVRERPAATPRELIRVLNHVLYDNVKNRMGKSDHVTLTLLELKRDGTVTFAGAHEELLVQRSGKIETLPTPGTWLGAMPDVETPTVDTVVKLQPGDLLVLHTDGVTEARNASGEMFGLERLVARIEVLRGREPKEVVEDIRAEVAAWAPKRHDDVTVLAARYRGLEAPRSP